MKKILLFTVFWCWIGVIGAVQVFPAETIKIAAIFAKSGDTSITDIYSYRGLHLAVEEINNHGGLLGRQVEIIEMDNSSTALGSKKAATKAVELDVSAVIGASWSSHSLAMAPVLQEAGIPMISPISTHPEVTLKGEYIFRVCFTDLFQGKVMAQFAYKDLNARTAVILTNINSDYSMGLAQFFKEAFLKNNGKVLWEEKYLEQTIDFTDVLKKIHSLEPDVVFVPSYPRDSGFLLKQAKKMGVQTLFLGGDGWNATIYDFAAEAAEENYFSNHWHADAPFSKSKKLLKDYRQSYGGGSVIAKVPLAYDAVMILADAIQRAQSLERSKIRDALAATKDFQGATGTISFDLHGDPKNKDALILQFKRGTVVFVKFIKP